MKVKRYVKSTTFIQRKLMMETYQKTHNISQSCKSAGLSTNTFRRWYPRYLEQGIEGPKKHIRKNLGRVPEKYACRPQSYNKFHRGRRTIASVIVKKNNDKKVISPGGRTESLGESRIMEKMRINRYLRYRGVIIK